MQQTHITILIFSVLFAVSLTHGERHHQQNNDVRGVAQYEDNEELNNEIDKSLPPDYDQYEDEVEKVKNNAADDDGGDDEDYEDYVDSLKDDESAADDTSDRKTKRQIGGSNKPGSKHIFDMIPLHRVPMMMFNALTQTIMPYSNAAANVDGTELAKLAQGFNKAVRTRHLGGFVGGLGLHAADFADHLAEVSKDVIGEHQRKTRSNQESRIFGKIAERIRNRSAGLLSIQNDHLPIRNTNDDIRVPFQSLGTAVRGLVDLIPAKRRKRYYYKHYEPMANEIKKGLNSTEFRNLLKNTYTSDLFAIAKDPQTRSRKVRMPEPRVKRC